MRTTLRLLATTLRRFGTSCTIKAEMRLTIPGIMEVLGVAMVAALIVVLAGCSSVNPRPSLEASAGLVSALPSDEGVSPSPAAAALPDLTASPPAGTLLTSISGTGERAVALPGLSIGSHQITIRFACIGNTGISIADQDGAFVLGVSGCDGREIYGTGFTSSPSDRGLRLAFEPDVSEPSVYWVIAVWSE